MIYGSRRRLERVPIGQVWIPKQDPAIGKTIPHIENKTNEDTISTKVKIGEQNKESIKSETSREIEVIPETNDKTDSDIKTKAGKKTMTKTKNKLKSSSDTKQSK